MLQRIVMKEAAENLISTPIFFSVSLIKKWAIICFIQAQVQELLSSFKRKLNHGFEEQQPIKTSQSCWTVMEKNNNSCNKLGDHEIQIMNTYSVFNSNGMERSLT